MQVNTAPEIQSMKGSNKLVKSAEPVGNQKRLVEENSDEKLAITLAIILMTIFGGRICALAFFGTNYAFSESGRGNTGT